MTGVGPRFGDDRGLFSVIPGLTGNLVRVSRPGSARSPVSLPRFGDDEGLFSVIPGLTGNLVRVSRPDSARSPMSLSLSRFGDDGDRAAILECRRATGCVEGYAG